MSNTTTESGEQPHTDIFQRKQEIRDLKRDAVRSGSITIMGQVVGTVIQIGSTVILARLLTPRDFGLVAIVLSFSLLLENFGLNGFSEAIIQSEDLNQRKSSALFWVNATISTVLALLFALAGPLLASIYHEPELTVITTVCAVSIVLAFLPVHHMAILRRNMQFGATTLIDFIARCVSIIVAIFFAWRGVGYWALVARQMTFWVTMAAGSWWVCRWRPGSPSGASGTWSLVRFALGTYAHFITDYLSRNVDKVLIGLHSGSTQLGYYKKAYDLFLMPVNQLSVSLSNVALASLRQLRDKPAQYRHSYLKAITALSLIGMATSGVLTLAGTDVIRVLLGPQWGDAGRLLTIFAPAIGITLLYKTHGWLHLSLGYAGRWFWWGLVEVCVTCASFAIGLQFGTQGVAAAFSLAFAILLAPGLSYAGRPVGLQFRHVFQVIWRHLVAATIATALGLVIVRAAIGTGTAASAPIGILNIVIKTAIFLPLYVALLIALSGGLAPFRQFQSIFRHLIPGRWKARRAGGRHLETPS